MAKRMNVVFRDDTARTVERLAKPGERSRLIDEAVRYYAASQSAEAIRERLVRSALRDRDLADETAREWSAVDLDTWPIPDADTRGKRPTHTAGKSIW